MDAHHRRQVFIRAIKIGLGTTLAILAAHALHLEFASTAGSICLITMLNPKMETIRLIGRRYISFAFTSLMAFLIFPSFSQEYIACALFLVVICLFTELLDWRNTLAVNALVGMHIMVEADYTIGFFANEFALLTVSVVIAFIFNLFDDYRGEEKYLFTGIHPAEQAMEDGLVVLQRILENKGLVPDYEVQKENTKKMLQTYLKDADFFAHNTFSPVTDYFVRYFSMRYRQFRILERIIRRALLVKQYPENTALVIGVIERLRKGLHLSGVPIVQLRRLDAALQEMENEPLPSTQEEVFTRSALIETLYGLREFLDCKRELVESLSPAQKTLYRYRNDASSIRQALKNPRYHFEEDKEKPLKF